MEEFISNFNTRRAILNYLGETLRWIYGSIWRTILKKEKFKYSEYIYGIKKSKNHYDLWGHKMNNRVIAVVFILLSFFFLNFFNL
ncbi:hypothetical protein [Polaribacter sp. Hel1_85]|uniref:hypothetical protein n=1 Tax=Polaribacter sp. Hel1_85 TaxID=1250005 RepID=UPI00052C2EBD|nr:hypothetical protein [Polaribacter sp. Hel1_85]KGL58407.1 hypothetical protein PHEL85_3466 [Polaribacter sp. Hel1_85]